MGQLHLGHVGSPLMARQEVNCIWWLGIGGSEPGTKWHQLHLGEAVVAHFGGSGSCTILLRMLWIWENLGRSLGSFCQQSSIRRCRGEGQFLGGGSRKPSSTALITWAMEVRGRQEAFRPSNTCTHPIPRKTQAVTRQDRKQVGSEEGPRAERSRVNGQRSGSWGLRSLTSWPDMSQ